MDKTSIYIQKIIIFMLVFSAGVFLFPLTKIYYLLPALFFALSFLISRITGEKPDFHYGLSKPDEIINNKSGVWNLFKWILILFYFVYDIIVWTLYGVYVLFNFFLDIILLIKTVLSWIIHAIISILGQFVPPLVFIYKMIIYYVFRWNWWIYKISFNNIRKSINRNFYVISLWGAILGLFVILLFYGVGLLMRIPGLVIIGAIFSILPLIWSFGEISSLRLRKAEEDDYPRVTKNFKSGFDAVKTVLGYFIIFLLIALGEVIFNILGWVPQIGFSFLGLAININTFATVILMFLFVILIFTKLILPPHIAYNKDFKPDLYGSLNFLGVIGKRFLRYLASSFSTLFFGIIIILIPALILFLSAVLTINVKNSILDARIVTLNRRSSVLDGLVKYRTDKEKERIIYYESFPQNILSDFAGMKFLIEKVNKLEQSVRMGEEEIQTRSQGFSAGIDSINKKIELLKTGSHAAMPDKWKISELEIDRRSRIDNFSIWEQEAEFRLGKLKIDLSDKKGLMIQLPFVFLLCIFWASFFGGLAIAFVVSYFGNVYFELYNFKEDDKPVYFNQVLSEIKSADHNQPLFGFTIIAIVLIVMINYNTILRFIGFQ